MNEPKKKKPANQHRVTPDSVLVAVNEFMSKIAYDPCWNRFSKVQAEFVSDGIESDGLTTDWHDIVEQAGGGGIFVNYPWNNPYAWVQKVVAESCIAGSEGSRWQFSDPSSGVLVWGPCYPETAAGQLIWNHASRICFWGKREGHPALPIDELGNILGDATDFDDMGKGTMWPTWLSYFGPHTARFEKVFGPHGNIVWGWNPRGWDPNVDVEDAPSSASSVGA